MMPNLPEAKWGDPTGGALTGPLLLGAIIFSAILLSAALPVCLGLFGAKRSAEAAIGAPKDDARAAPNSARPADWPPPRTLADASAASAAGVLAPTHGGGMDTAASAFTTAGPITVTGGQPGGQPANPVSVPSQPPKPARPPGTPRAAPGPSYESDSEGDTRSTAKERYNDITRSVKTHAIGGAAGGAALEDARQAEEAARRIAAERASQAQHEGPNDNGEAGGPAAANPAQSPPQPLPASAAQQQQQLAAPTPPSPAAAAAALPSSSPPELAAAGPSGGVAAGGHADAGPSAPAAGGAECEVDLDIDLTKGDLKVDYSTRGLLGQGGFAAVYKGRYKGQRVAVKMIKKTAGSSLADLQEDMNALMHELHILRQVNHPNIVTLFGGCLKPPHIFLVEERMEGTLDFYVHQVRKADPLSVREVVYFALDIGCGLSYLHPRIVHRDLKPANVLLSREGRCKISDFGLARTKMKEYLSTKNLDAGTTAYIAPECFMSMDNPDMHDLRRSVTDRTDIYAMGIIIWEMLAGKRPWQGLKPLLVAYQVAYRSLRPPLYELGPRCPPKLRALIEDCWCQEPKRRPSSQQVVDRLLEILNELPKEEEYILQQPQPQQPLPQLQQPQPRSQQPQAQAPLQQPQAPLQQPQAPRQGGGGVVSPQDVRLH